LRAALSTLGACSITSAQGMTLSANNHGIAMHQLLCNLLELRPLRNRCFVY
jgi:hypothetical protein